MNRQPMLSLSSFSNRWTNVNCDYANPPGTFERDSSSHVIFNDAIKRSLSNTIPFPVVCDVDSCETPWIKLTRDSDSGLIETETAADVAIVPRLEIATCLAEFRRLFINRRPSLSYHDSPVFWRWVARDTVSFISLFFRFSFLYKRDSLGELLLRKIFVLSALFSDYLTITSTGWLYLGFFAQYFRKTNTATRDIYFLQTREFQLICNCQLSLSGRQYASLL